jgi:DNA-binding MarR family transcriptional regulator
MSSTSVTGADAFRQWLKLTLAMHVEKAPQVPGPQRPIGWMVLAHLWIQPDGSDKFSAIQAELKISTAASLSKALGRLEDAKLVEVMRGRTSDGREVEVRLTSVGRSAIGKTHQRAFPSAK